MVRVMIVSSCKGKLHRKFVVQVFTENFFVVAVSIDFPFSSRVFFFHRVPPISFDSVRHSVQTVRATSISRYIDAISMNSKTETWERGRGGGKRMKHEKKYEAEKIHSAFEEMSIKLEKCR